MATAREILRERESEIDNEVDKSLHSFDLTAPLTEEELVYSGMSGVLPGGDKALANHEREMPLLQEIEDNEEAQVDAVETFTDRNSYNVQYVRYMKCQAILALAAFTEGWSAFEELALKAYVKQAKLTDEQYRGDDPHKAFSLRVKRQAAEDFFKFVKGVIAEAAATPKPSIATK